MAFKDFPEQQDVVQLLQRSLERGRLGHAYLFCGTELGELEGVARTLAKTLNCEQPPRRSTNGLPLDCCDTCAICRKWIPRTTPVSFGFGPHQKCGPSPSTRCAI